MSSTTPRFALLLALSLACGPVSSETEGSGTTLPDPTGSSGSPPTGSATDDTPTGAGTDDPPVATGSTSEVSTGTLGGTSVEDSESGFVSRPDFCAADCSGFCDPWAQDCPEGLKCAAWADDGGQAWNATKCVPAGDRLPGESCTAEGGGFSGVDDCVKGAMCWRVDEDGAGTCVAQCTGSEQAPVCAEGHVCPLTGEGVLNLCLPTCDPLGSDCPAGDVCVPSNKDFLCAKDLSGDEGQANDPCAFANQCDPGLVCIDAGTASIACDPQEIQCCQPFCEFPGGACPNPDQACVQGFDPDTLPPNDPKLAIGVCMIP